MAKKPEPPRSAAANANAGETKRSAKVAPAMRADHAGAGLCPGGGAREAEAQAAGLRIRGGGDVGSVPVPEILSRLRKERDEKSLTLWG